MITFGLTGGIACGKSTVTKTFIKHAIPIVDADVVARQVVEPGKPALQSIISTFGSSILLENGNLNRAKLAEIVFTDKQSMSFLNEIMGPAIEEEAGRQIKMFHSQNHYLVGYDAALICEMGNENKYRPLIVVYCSRDTQIERLMKRNALTRDQAVARIDSQMSHENKIKKADFTIDTSGTIEESIKKTELIIDALRAK